MDGLERLREEKLFALNHLIDSQRTLCSAFGRRQSANDAMFLAYKAKCDACIKLEVAWHEYQHAQHVNAHEIALLAITGQELYQTAQCYLDAENYALHRADRPAMKNHRRSATKCEVKLKRNLRKRQRLGREVVVAQQNYIALERAFQQALAALKAAVSAFHSAKNDHERAKCDREQAMRAYEYAAAAYDSSWSESRAEIRAQPAIYEPSFG